MQAPASRPDRTLYEAMAAYLRTHLVKSSHWQSGETFTALGETALRFNESSWFWADDNAKSAEFLCEPGLYNDDPDTANAAIDFVLRLSTGPIIRRRGGAAELRVLSVDPAAFRIETAFFIVEGDLTAGIIRQSLRFNDGRAHTAGVYTGNSVGWRHWLWRTRLRVETAISAHHIAVEARSVSLSFTATVRRKSWFSRAEGPDLGTVTYTYEVSADRPSIGLRVTLAPAQGVTLSGATLTTAIDQVGSLSGANYRALAIRSAGQDKVVRRRGEKAVGFHKGTAEYSALLQENGSPGFAYGLHTLLLNGDRLKAITGYAQRYGRLRTVVHRYAAGTITANAPFTIREERLLTGGGYYNQVGHYIAVMRDADGGGEADPSMTYDIGAELNAIALHILFARRGHYRPAPSQDRLLALTGWYDRHVDAYFAFVRAGEAEDSRRVFTRGLAFVVLSLDCMLRATGNERYRVLMDTGVRLILALAHRERLGHDATAVTFADLWDQQAPFLDCQAACTLALARAAWHGDPDNVLGRTAVDAILGIRLYTGSIGVTPDQREAYDGLATIKATDPSRVDSGFWSFKLGLVLRALAAVRRGAEAGVIPLTAVEAQRLKLRSKLAEDHLSQAYRWHDGQLEVLTSSRAGETNSETQPWTALGLAPLVDDLIADCGVKP